MRVAVVGGGLGGLLAAGTLHRRGAAVTVFEAADTVGGVATSIHEDGYLLETAAGSFPLPHPVLGPLLAEADVAVVARPGRAVRFVSDGGRFRPLPTNPLGLAGIAFGLLGPSAVGRAVVEPLVRTGTAKDETVAGHLRRRFGPAGGAAAGLVAGGVFAGDPDRLELASAFPTLPALEREHGSVVKALVARRRTANGTRPTLHLPVGGMSALADGLARLVGDVRTGARIDRATEVGSGWRIADEAYDGLVLAVPPSVAGRILGRDLGDDPPRVPVAVVGLGGPPDAVPGPDGFGGLVLAEAGLATLGVLVERGPGRCPDGHHLLKVLVGGARDPDSALLDDDLLVDRVLAEVGPLVGSAVHPTWVGVARQHIPQYVGGHAARVRTVDDELGPGVATAGWWYRGIGVASLATDAEVVAERVLAAG